MKKYLIIIIIAFILFSFCDASATWSIIIVDPESRQIGIAGASCTYSCYGIGEIVPDVGAIVVQAMSNNHAREKGVQMMLAESSPEEIIQAMRDSIFDPERQQYAVITINYISEPKIYSGRLTNYAKGGLTDYGVSVQGNTLASEAVLQAVMNAVQKAKTENLHIADILMIALEAGSIAGGDKRCGDQKATSAFITVAKPEDKKPYIHLLIFGQGKGKQNAVDLLRIKYDRWKRKHGDELKK